MTAAIVNLCFDPRLNHELVRIQTKTRLEAENLKVDRIFVTNEAGGNVGTGLRNAIDLLTSSREPVLFIALLDHDECQAAAAGVRQPLEDRIKAVSAYAREKRLTCPIAGGTILTQSNTLQWTDWPATG